MTAEQLYSVVFAGELLPGRELGSVKAALASQFKIPPAQIDTLFGGRVVTIRRNLPLEKAIGLSAAFQKAGARCELRPPVPEQTELQKRAAARAAAAGRPEAKPSTVKPVATAKPAAPMRPAAVKAAARNPAVAEKKPAAVSKPGGTAKRVPAKPAAPAAKPVAAPQPAPVGLPPGLGGRLTSRETAPRRRLLRRVSAGVALLLPAAYPATLILLGVVVLTLLLRPLLGGQGLGQIVGGGVSPALLVAAVMLWLLRPALGRQVPAAAVMVAPEQMPALRALVASLAEQLEAPEPDDVIVDMMPRVQGRWRVPLLRPREAELQLHIGLPLLAAVDARQMAGLIAEALAAAAPNNAPLLLQWLQDSVSWLNRLSRRRGAMDVRLDQWVARRDGPARALAEAASAILRAPHRLLAALANAAAVVARPLLRRRDLRTFDYQRQVAGGEAVADALRRSLHLRHAIEELNRELKQVDGRELYCSDVAGLAARIAERRAEQEEDEPELDDADPACAGLSYDERLEAAATGDTPLMTQQGPAIELVSGYVDVARQLSVEHYVDLGLEVDPTKLIPVTRARAALSVRKQRADALDDYFRNALLAGHAVRPTGFEEALALDSTARVERLRQAVAQVRQAVPELLELARQYPAAAEALLNAEVAAAVARYRPDAEVEPALRRARAAFAKLEGLRGRYDSLFGERLGIGLAEAVQRGGDQQRMIAKVKPALNALAALAGLEPDLANCRREIAIALGLSTTRGPGAKIPASSFLTQMSNALKRIERLHQRLDAVHIEQGAIADRLRSVLPPLPDDADVPALQNHLVALDLALERIRRRVMGRLAVLAGGAEVAHGIRVKLVG